MGERRLKGAESDKKNPILIFSTATVSESVVEEIESGLDEIINNRLNDFCGRSRFLGVGRKVFDEMPHRRRSLPESPVFQMNSVEHFGHLEDGFQDWRNLVLASLLPAQSLPESRPGGDDWEITGDEVILQFLLRENMAEVGLTVGGAFLSASLQVLFDRLASREVLNLFSNRKTNVDGLLKELKRKLLLLNKVLGDADVKQFTDTNVRAWSDEARDAVYRAGDLLSEITYEARRLQVESDPSSLGQVKNWFSNYLNSFDVNIEIKLKYILQLLDALLQEVVVLGLKKGVRFGANMPTNNRSSSSVVFATDVYGRVSEKEKLIERLLQLDETTVDVIPVVAMGGMGKTTLAQLAYNDEEVHEKFKTMKAWVCVSEDFDILRVTKTILESITGRSCSFTDLNQVQESLKTELNGMKFLIVLDDVWNKNYGDWDTLRTPFRTGAPGSKIIVTTRIQGAADIMKTGPVIKLPELSDDVCWLLFAGIAFGGSNPSSYPPQLEEIGRKIVERCRGLPLAVKSIAGLLRSKQLDVGEWEDVLNSEFWDLPEDECDILPALRLSYHYLPSYLKQCFAFCSIYPKNHEFGEKETVSLWIAQKFVSPLKGSSYEQEGKKCFRELLSMSFFQRITWYSENDPCFVMHDLIHDLAQVVSGQFCFRFDGTDQNEITDKVRHCSYQERGFQQFQAATEVTTLRTFLPISVYRGLESCAGLDILVLSRQKQLRVLSLIGYDKLNELSDLVGGLLHLQYLDLSRTRDMEQLPESICRLYNLETLLLAGCSRLSSLPVEMGKLISLCRLDITGTSLKEMPIQMSQLKSLEYLSTFVVGKESGLAIGGLKAWNCLRGELEISGLENVRHKKDALEAKLVEKEYLETLALGWGGVSNDSKHEREVLDGLRPHRHLKVLRIRNYGGTGFPDWLGDRVFTQMVYLRLEDCSYCSCLPPLGQLASLKELYVKGMGSVTDVGKEFLGSFGVINQPFPSLEALCFEDMVEWVTWSLPETGEFPKLRKLEIINCPMLVGTLPEVNIATSVIERCSNLEASVPSSSPPSFIAADVGILELRLSERVELKWLAMSDLVELRISDLPSLQVLTSELSALTKLKTLMVAKCRNLLSLSNSGLPPMLTRLVIDKCELLQSVVDGMVSHNTCSLEILDVRDCPLLASFADNGLPTTLKYIDFQMCPKLELSLSEGIEMCPSVEELTLYGCPSLQFLMLVKLFPNVRSLFTGGDDNLWILNVRGCPQGGGRLANLTYLSIERCKKLKALPEGMCDVFPSLESVSLKECPEIESLFEVSLLSKLEFLNIWKCEKLTSFQSDWGLHRFPSLRVLHIGEDVESFPNEGLLPSTLTTLHIYGFENLKKLNWRGIRQLTSLEFLWIQDCPQLESLPDEGLPPSLSILWIEDCPLLTARCKKDSGDDWPKIAHIPTIFLD